MVDSGCVHVVFAPALVSWTWFDWIRVVATWANRKRVGGTVAALEEPLIITQRQIELI